MEFKVGNRVKDKVFGEGKVVEIGENILVQFLKRNNRLHNGSSGKNGPYKNNTCYWYSKSTQELEKLDYTYTNLVDSPIGTKVTFDNIGTLVKTKYNRLENDMSLIYINELADLQDCIYGRIIKIEEPEYETLYEAKKEILDEVEKKYLRNIVLPFKEKIKTIKKIHIGINGEQIRIFINPLCDTFSLPAFKSNTMYKGMEADKEYTLKELGL